MKPDDNPHPIIKTALDKLRPWLDLAHPLGDSDRDKLLRHWTVEDVQCHMAVAGPMLAGLMEDTGHRTLGELIEQGPWS
jgi:hypothetical protein